MPKECVDKLMKKGMSREKANKVCYPKGKKKTALEWQMEQTPEKKLKDKYSA